MGDFFQGNIADKAVLFINTEIIKKSNAIDGLGVFEDQEFHDNVQVIQTQAHHKPINLVVTLVGLVKDFTLICGCGYLLYTQIGPLSFALIFCVYIHFKVFSTIQARSWEESLGRSAKSRYINYLSSLSLNNVSVKEIRFFNFGGYLLKEYNRVFNDIYKKIFKLRFKQVFWPVIPLIFSASINLFAFYIVVQKVSGGHLEFGAFLILLQALNYLHLSVASFGEQAGWVTGHLLFFKKYHKFLETEEKVYLPADVSINNHQKFSQIEWNAPINITFDNVSFTYPSGKCALRNINFCIETGEKIAFVGANGSGKSTLIKLLCGFYQPTEGQILINKTPLSEIDIHKWRNIISPVFQDFSKYNLSLEQNIIMGNEADNFKLRNAIEESKILDIVEKLPNGLNQQLGTMFGGSDLSGGQWQKVAIARALYKEASIYIFDEPTASLDPITENEIFELFKKVENNKIVFFVTHRLGSIKQASRIFVLENGELVGAGAHHFLIEQNQLYKKMFNSQSSNYVL